MAQQNEKIDAPSFLYFIATDVCAIVAKSKVITNSGKHLYSRGFSEYGALRHPLD